MKYFSPTAIIVTVDTFLDIVMARKWKLHSITPFYMETLMKKYICNYILVLTSLIRVRCVIYTCQYMDSINVLEIALKNSQLAWKILVLHDHGLIIHYFVTPRIILLYMFLCMWKTSLSHVLFPLQFKILSNNLVKIFI